MRQQLINFDMYRIESIADRIKTKVCLYDKQEYFIRVFTFVSCDPGNDFLFFQKMKVVVQVLQIIYSLKIFTKWNSFSHFLEMLCKEELYSNNIINYIYSYIIIINNKL